MTNLHDYNTSDWPASPPLSALLDTVHCCDALTLLRALPDASVDLIATDWPYNMDKAEWDTWKTDADYLQWMRPHLAEMRRVLKPNGSYYGFASPYLAAHVEILTGEYLHVLTRITWRKPPYSTKAEMFDKDIMRAYFPASEAIIFAEQYGADSAEFMGYGYSNGLLHSRVMQPLRDYMNSERERAGLTISDIDKATNTSMASHWFTHPSQWMLPTKESYELLRVVFNAKGNEFLRREYEDLRREYEDLRRPFNVSADVPYTDVWDFATVNTYPGKHPCEKPAAMMQHIVNASSRPGALVLDPFCGSGATLAAAYQLGRQYIGGDMDAGWVQVARNKCVKEFGGRKRSTVSDLGDLPLFAELLTA